MVKSSQHDWNGERGKRWLANLEVLEASLAPVDSALLEELQFNRALRIAEVGSGGGSTTRYVLRHAPAGTQIDGYDISEPLVEHARGKTSPDTDTISYFLQDAATAKPPGSLYDCLFSRFGVMFFADEQQAFHNLSHFLTPGGHFVFAVWGSPKNNPWHHGIYEILKDYVELPTVSPDDPGPFRYADVDKLLGILNRAGFKNIRSEKWSGRLPIGGNVSAEDATRFALESFSGFKDALQEAPESVRSQALAKVHAFYSRYEEDGKTRVDAEVHFVRGER